MPGRYRISRPGDPIGPVAVGRSAYDDGKPGGRQGRQVAGGGFQGVLAPDSLKPWSEWKFVPLVAILATIGYSAAAASKPCRGRGVRPAERVLSAPAASHWEVGGSAPSRAGASPG